MKDIKNHKIEKGIEKTPQKSSPHWKDCASDSFPDRASVIIKIVQYCLYRR